MFFKTIFLKVDIDKWIRLAFLNKRVAFFRKAVALKVYFLEVNMSCPLT